MAWQQRGSLNQLTPAQRGERYASWINDLVTDDPLENMRSRAEQCRRLADRMHDPKMKWQLLEWANEFDADAERFEAERRSRRRLPLQT